MATTGVFKYINPASYDPEATEPFKKPWSKVDGPGTSYTLLDQTRLVENLHGQESSFTTDNSGFSLHKSATKGDDFTDASWVTTDYYAEVEELLRAQLPGVKKVVIFDHTIRRRQKDSPRAPVQLVHVDQTPFAAEQRVRRHVTAPEEAEELLKGRYQIINVWRPIQNPASDTPLAVIDWRSMDPSDFVKVDLLYPKDWAEGKEKTQDPNSEQSTDGYEVKGEVYNIAPNEKHRFYYVKDMRPDEAMFLKCFDSRSQTMTGTSGIAHGAGHTAFVDPQTPEDAPGRQSIEVRCLVFYE